MSDTLERNLEQATYYIDLLDMLQTKMKGNLSEWEEQYIIHSLSELKLNFIDEQKKGDQENNSKEEKVDDAIDKNKVSKPKKKVKKTSNKNPKTAKKKSK